MKTRILSYANLLLLLISAQNAFALPKEYYIGLIEELEQIHKDFKSSSFDGHKDGFGAWNLERIHQSKTFLKTATTISQNLNQENFEQYREVIQRFEKIIFESITIKAKYDYSAWGGLDTGTRFSRLLRDHGSIADTLIKPSVNGRQQDHYVKMLQFYLKTFSESQFQEKKVPSEITSVIERVKSIPSVKAFFVPILLNVEIQHGNFSTNSTPAFRFGPYMNLIGDFKTEAPYEFLSYIRKELNWSGQLLSNVTEHESAQLSLRQSLESLDSDVPLKALKFYMSLDYGTRDHLKLNATSFLNLKSEQETESFFKSKYVQKSFTTWLKAADSSMDPEFCRILTAG